MTKIYVSGFPRDIGEKELGQLFAAEFGEVLEVTITRNPGNGSTGRGWVTMSDMRAAMCAVQGLNGSSYGNHVLRVELACEARRRPANHATIFVGNLCYAVTEEDLRSVFEPYGVVERLTIVKDRETGRPRGYAFLEMEAGEAEQAAADLHGREWGGRPLTVRMRSGAQP
jgi:RNA recognition motif-containing protein